MEKIEGRTRIPIYLIIIVLAVAAIAAGAYFLFGRKGEKEPHRGTYVYEQRIEENDYV